MTTVCRLIALLGVAGSYGATAGEAPAPPWVASLPTDVPTLSAAELAPGAQPLLLPLHLPGFDLRVLDQRKTVSVPSGTASAGRLDVRLPIYFYIPAEDRREGLRIARDAADDLRRAAHLADRSDADLDGILARLERGLALLGRP